MTRTETVLLPPQLDTQSILNEDDRLFTAFGTVEIKDRQGEILPIEEFKKVMPVFMKRGGPLMDMHSNRQIGKVLNYEFTEKDGHPALHLTCQVFKDYPVDDIVWSKIKNGEYSGLSFGGSNQKREFDFKNKADILRQLSGFEFSTVDSTGNQSALMTAVNYLAKADVTKPPELDRCVADLMSDPEFSPRDPDQTKEQAAFAVCTAALNKELVEEHIGKALNYLCKQDVSDHKTNADDSHEESMMAEQKKEVKKQNELPPEEKPALTLEMVAEKVAMLEGKIDQLLSRLATAPAVSEDNTKADNDEEPDEEETEKTNDKSETVTSTDVVQDKEKSPPKKDTAAVIKNEDIEKRVNEAVARKVEEIKKSLNIGGSTPRPAMQDITQEILKGNHADELNPLDIAQGKVKVSMGQIIQKQIDDQQEAVKKALGY